MKWKIPLFKVYWDEDDVESVTKVIRRGSYWSTGPEIEQIEKAIAEFIGTKYALSFNSGTSALHADLLAHNITDGEVITPSFTFIATANTVVLAGARPIFAEIEDKSYGLDSEDVNEKITNKTRAIIPVHYGGAPCKEINALKEIAEDNNLILIEDAAESFGSAINNKKIGTFGNSSMFSFCQNKIITGGEGGVLVTNSKDIFDKLKLICSHGRQEDKDGYFSTTKELDYIQVGFNFRMSSMTAALISSQLKKIDKIIKMRNEKAKYYDEKLSKINGIKIPRKIKNSSHVYQMYTIQVDPKLRDDLIKHLARDGIMSKVYFHPVHHTHYYRKILGYNCDLPVTEKISKQVLSLPIYPDLTKDEIDMIINSIKNFEGK
jgi:dTDP-4-amino-4,6-dideoxygalactose transaminase